MKDNLLLLLRIVLILTAQLFLFNQIQFWGMGCVFIYSYCIITLPLAFKPSWVMIIAAVIGLIVDIFSQTLGLHMAATVLIGFLRPYILQLFFTSEELEKYEPSFANFGFKFYKYALIMVLIHHTCLFLLEAFTFRLLLQVAIKISISSLLTMIFIFFIESLRKNRLNARR